MQHPVTFSSLLNFVFILSLLLLQLQNSAFADKVSSTSALPFRLELLSLPRTKILPRLPLFGGLRSVLRVIRPKTHLGRKSDYRSEHDENYVNYSGFQLWKLILNTRRNNSDAVISADLQKFVQSFGSEVWNINQDGIDVLIDYKNTAKAKEFIGKTDFSHSVMIDDVEKAIDETYIQVNNTNPKMPWLERESTLMNWNRYHDLGDIQQYLQHMLGTYPEIAEIIQIGLTRNKRPLEVLRISNGDPNNWAVVITAGMQARDWLSPAALTLAISKLTYLWDTNAEYMRNIDWYFLPIANPDGYQYSRIVDRLWTKNRHFDAKTGCYGVNLDRNFEFEWGKAGTTDNACKNLYCGPKKFSEPETKAMRAFMLGLKKVMGAYVSLDAYGQAITYPWGDSDYVTDNQKQLLKVARKAMMNLRKLNEAEYRVGTSYRLKLAHSGNSADWVQQRINPQYVYSVYLKDQGRYGYLMPPHYIVESGEEVFSLMSTIASTIGTN